MIGGHSKGFDKPFHIKTHSERVLRNILDELKINPILFNLWRNQQEEDSRVLSDITQKNLMDFIAKNYSLIALGRYIEKSMKANGYDCTYLPHPASRDAKYIKALKTGLSRLR